MNILIVSATPFEAEPLLAHFTYVKTGHSVKTCTYKNKQIDLLITGIGMTATAFWLGKVLTQKKYDYAFNMGLAGSFNRNIPLGSVVHVSSDRLPELGAEDGERLLSLTEMNLEGEDVFPFKNGWIFNACTAAIGLMNVNGITVNKVHGNRQSIEEIKKRCNPDVESMEGAAFLYACLVEQVPCAQIRSISNYVEPRNKEAWNIPLAISNLNVKMKAIVDEL